MPSNLYVSAKTKHTVEWTKTCTFGWTFVVGSRESYTFMVKCVLVLGDMKVAYKTSHYCYRVSHGYILAA